MTPRSIALALVAVLSGPASHSLAQTRPSYFDQPSTVRVVGTPRAGEAVPAIVFLPATGGTSERMFEQARSVVPFPSYVAILPPGTPTSSDYLPNFGGFVSWMESRVIADLERAELEHAIDPLRIHLVGFSLGGDTAWALFSRRPDVFVGAAVMGSRASARPSSASRRTMLDRGCRVGFAIGNADDASRVAGATKAVEYVRRYRVPTDLLRFEGAHAAPDEDTMRRLLAFVMAPTPAP